MGKGPGAASKGQGLTLQNITRQDIMITKMYNHVISGDLWVISSSSNQSFNLFPY